jgi:hypothetical protein
MEAMQESLCIAILISTSKTALSFLLLLMSSLQQNWRKGQNRFCLKMRGVERRGRGRGARERNGPNNVCTYEYMNKKKKKEWSFWFVFCLLNNKTFKNIKYSFNL